MAKIIVKKSNPLKGKVKIDGAKNAVLPIIAATLLVKGKSVLHEVPDLTDVHVISDLIRHLGAEVEYKDNTLTVDASNLTTCEAPYELVRKMRASFFVMGPLLARFNQTKISMPGGCSIGTRPIDLHLKGFKALGAEIVMDHGFVEAKADKLVGSKLYLDFPSVGATENIMMAAVLAEGTTIIENAAEEPEIVDLANFLNEMGADVKGAGTNTIRIKGVKELKGTEHDVIPDRIEAATYMVAAAMTKGDITVENVLIEHLKPVTAKLILADEPTGALDSKSSKMLLEKLTYLNNNLEATILMVTHDAYAASYATRIIFIKDGKIYNEIRKGNDTRKEFFDKIIDVVTLLGGDINDAL